MVEGSELWRVKLDPQVLQYSYDGDVGFNEASFPTAEVGYLMDLATRVFKTEDGGQHWHLLHGIRGHDVAFATAEVGYVVGENTLYRTEDGGITWRPTLVPLPPIRGNTADPFSRLLLPYPGVGEPDQSSEAVLTWFRQTYGPRHPPVPITIGSLAHSLTPLSEVDAFASNQKHIFLTADGGYHWTLLGQPWKSGPLGGVARLDATLWYAAAGYDNRIYRSTDGGQSWHPRGTVGGVAGPLAFPTAQVGYTTGPISQPRYPYGYGLYKTEDAGATWRRLETQVPGWATGLTFLGEQHGFVAGEKGILMRTVDGGKTWTQPNLPVKPMLAPPIFPTPEVGYAVGSRSTILKTTDGGEHWVVLTHGSARFEKTFER